MATLAEFLAAHVTAANRTAVAEAVAAVGDVSLTVSQLRDSHGFKYAPHPLEDHFQAFCKAAGIDLDAPWEPGTPLAKFGSKVR